MKKTTVRKNGQLFGKMDILKHFFEDPEREYHLREIARLAKIAPSTASKHLSSLVKAGIITSTPRKGLSIFKPNTENKIYRDLKLFHNIFAIRNSGLLDFLVEEFNHPKAIILFGSFRKSENVPSSDIDIFVEAPVRKNVDLSGFEEKLGHSIQLFQLSSKEVGELKLKNKELLNSIVNGIALEGFFEVFK